MSEPEDENLTDDTAEPVSQIPPKLVGVFLGAPFASVVGEEPTSVVKSIAVEGMAQQADKPVYVDAGETVEIAGEGLLPYSRVGLKEPGQPLNIWLSQAAGDLQQDPSGTFLRFTIPSSFGSAAKKLFIVLSAPEGETQVSPVLIRKPLSYGQSPEEKEKEQEAELGRRGFSPAIQAIAKTSGNLPSGVIANAATDAVADIAQATGIASAAEQVLSKASVGTNKVSGQTTKPGFAEKSPVTRPEPAVRIEENEDFSRVEDEVTSEMTAERVRQQQAVISKNVEAFVKVGTQGAGATQESTEAEFTSTQRVIEETQSSSIQQTESVKAEAQEFVRTKGMRGQMTAFVTQHVTPAGMKVDSRYKEILKQKSDQASSEQSTEVLKVQAQNEFEQKYPENFAAYKVQTLSQLGAAEPGTEAEKELNILAIRAFNAVAKKNGVLPGSAEAKALIQYLWSPEGNILQSIQKDLRVAFSLNSQVSNQLATPSLAAGLSAKKQATLTVKKPTTKQAAPSSITSTKTGKASESGESKQNADISAVEEAHISVDPEMKARLQALREKDVQVSKKIGRVDRPQKKAEGKKLGGRTQKLQQPGADSKGGSPQREGQQEQKESSSTSELPEEQSPSSDQQPKPEIPESPPQEPKISQPFRGSLAEEAVPVKPPVASAPASAGAVAGEGAAGSAVTGAATRAGGTAVAAEGGAAAAAVGGFLAANAATIAIVLGVIVAICIFLLTFVYVGCNWPIGKLPLLSGPAAYTGSAIGTAGYPEICAGFDEFSNGALTDRGAEEAFNNPGLLSTGNWTAAINSAVSKYPGADACMLRVVVQKESGGKADAVGCDCAANGRPQACLDPSKNYYPGYNFNWDQCSYGIGLTQWTIYPRASSENWNAWQNPTTPSRNILGDKYYTVPELLSPELSLDLAARYFSNALKANGGNVRAAFRNYLGGGAPENWLNERMALYDMCRNSSK